MRGGTASSFPESRYQSRRYSFRFKRAGSRRSGSHVRIRHNETDELMPLPIIMAHKLTRKLAEVRKSGEIGWIRPDGKSQVSVQYKDGRPESIIAIVVSTQHAPNITSDEIEKTITEKVIKPVCGKWWNDEIKIFVNLQENLRLVVHTEMLD